MFKKLLLLIAVLCSLNAHAGKDTGNGADGVLINGRPYLFDLFEHGIHLQPIYDASIEVPEDIQKEIAQSLSFLHPEAAKILMAKIAEIRRSDRFLALELLITMRSYFWSQIRDVRLLNINDEDGTDIDYPVDKLVQLAARRASSIKIDMDYLSRMNYSNQAALILHEVVYAMMPPKLLGQDRNFKKLFSSAAPTARMLTAYLFSRIFTKVTSASLDAMIKGINSELGAYLLQFVKIQSENNYVPSFLGISSNRGLYTEYGTPGTKLFAENKFGSRLSINYFYLVDTFNNYGEHSSYVDPTNEKLIGDLRTVTCDSGKPKSFRDEWHVALFEGKLIPYSDDNHEMDRTYFSFIPNVIRNSSKIEFNPKDFPRDQRQQKCRDAFDAMAEKWRKSELTENDI